MAKIHIEIWNRRRMILATCIVLWILAVPDILPGLVVLWALFNYRKAVLRLCWRLLKTVLWLYWRLLYYCTGLFFWHFLYKVLVHPSGEEYAHQGQHQQQHQQQQYQHQQQQQHQHQHQQQQQPIARGVIQTWKYCKLYDNQHIPRSTFDGLFLRRRFVAHVDTGNSATTAISKDALDALYPGGQGVVRKGTMRVQGVTGVPELFPLVEIRYELDGVVGPNNKPLCVSVDAIVTHTKFDHDILISAKDMKIFHDRYHYTIQVVERASLFGM